MLSLARPIHWRPSPHAAHTLPAWKDRIHVYHLTHRPGSHKRDKALSGDTYRAPVSCTIHKMLIPTSSCRSCKKNAPEKHQTHYKRERERESPRLYLHSPPIFPRFHRKNEMMMMREREKKQKKKEIRVQKKPKLTRKDT